MVAPLHWQIVIVVAWNTLIAGVLMLAFGNDEPIRSWVYSNLIGFIIWGEHYALWRTTRGNDRALPGWVHAAACIVTVPVGLYGGAAMGALLWGQKVRLPDVAHDRTSLAFTLLITLLGVVFWWSRARHAELRARDATHAEALEAQERRATEAHLKLLQTQLEPHFLFNTLGVLDSMIATEPQRARDLLQSLNRYLRTALLATRASDGGHTLDAEATLIESYLQIMQMRFGERLRFSIHIDAASRALAFPTMLLQPLVENAIRHGIEPSKDGGAIEVHAHCTGTGTGSRLTIEVADTGIGLSDAPTTRGTGAGLANIRERLAALFGGDARIRLEDHAPRGVMVRLELPCQPCRAH